MRLLQYRAWLLTAALALASVAHVQSAEAPATAHVTIDNFAFSPQTLTVNAGTSVTWVNHDAETHSVRGIDMKELHSPGLDEDETFAFTFTTPGIYTYYCGLHPHMTGTVVVR